MECKHLFPKTKITKVLPKIFLVNVIVLSFAAVTTSAAVAQRANPMDGVAEQLGLEPAQLQSCLGEPPAPVHVHLKWSGKFGQRAKVYPTRTNGYENDKATELFRQFQSYCGA